jgi:uncharacterized protein (TIGR02266 family)
LRENRKHERVEARLRCWCEGENVTFYARVGNLSEGGLFLRTSTPLEMGTQAKIRLETRGPDEVCAFARVVWSRMDGSDYPPGMGLRFENIDEAGLAVLRQIIENEQRAKQSAG